MVEALTKNPLRASLVICGAGLAAFWSGMFGPFMGDDNLQIVNNPVIHSLSNFFLFFQGGTFYDGNGIAPLSGNYRPLGSVVFAVLYAIFGLNPAAFHVVSLLIYVCNAVILYHVLRSFIQPLLALSLALLFVVHPINSAVVYNISAMPDVLFFFFGILAIWVLIRFPKGRSIVAVAALLFLSLLSKETAVLFVAMAGLYLLLFDRRRLPSLVGVLLLPVSVYLVLRVSAVGSSVQHSAPIDFAPLSDRLLTLPAILEQYVSQLLWPDKLAMYYYWVVKSFSFGQVVLPALVDAAAIGLLIFLGLRVRRKAPSSISAYLFFATWLVLGMSAYVQIVPLDATVASNWFYFPFAGLLGIIGISAATLIPRPLRWQRVIATAMVAASLLLLGIRTSFRGQDFADEHTLVMANLAASPNDQTDEAILASELLSQGQPAQALAAAQLSLSWAPTAGGYEIQGMAYYALKNFAAAQASYLKLLPYGQVRFWYDDIGQTMVWYGDYSTNVAFLKNAVALYPTDASLWEYLAIVEYQHGNVDAAKQGITNAYTYSQMGSVPAVYQVIISGKPLKLVP